ncbi:MAG: hypothetical protein DSZ16_05245 [Candidatus Thioglobus sp.]|nr:MAG: hypothetical protein DSZ16_05245 [Candidatus Thioglobus sp.]
MVKIKVLALLLICNIAMANYTNPSVNRLIQSNNDPVGVIFELIETDKNTWEWAAPMIEDLRIQLKDKYPNIEIAVVSHGREQFQLLKRRSEKHPKAMSILEDLVRKENVNLYVCGTHSSWFNIEPSNYMDIVDVAESGPAKINDYINLGYQSIKLSKPIQTK